MLFPALVLLVLLLAAVAAVAAVAVVLLFAVAFADGCAAVAVRLAA